MKVYFKTILDVSGTSDDTFTPSENENFFTIIFMQKSHHMNCSHDKGAIFKIKIVILVSLLF